MENSEDRRRARQDQAMIEQFKGRLHWPERAAWLAACPTSCGAEAL